jgi:alpha-D-ribose 1-methylphosphonate 5-triphosphate diphosphatase
MSETVFTNALLVLPDGTVNGHLHVAHGRIASVQSGPAPISGAIDCGGDVLMPGLIELHTDNLERHLHPRPGVDWPHMPALLAHDAELAAMGITTVYDALRVGSILSSGRGYGDYARSLADEIHTARAAGAFRISHLLHLRAEICSETLTEELDRFGPYDQVGLVSLMDHTPGQRQFADLSQLRRYMRGKYGLTEDEFAAHVAAQTLLGNRVRAPHEACAVAAAARLGAVLASHDDTTPEQVAQSHRHGARLAEFPTTRAAAAACRDTGIAVMMGAPNLIRGGSHSGNVAARDLAEAGLLDLLSSDYVPSALLQGAFLLADIWGDLARAVGTVTSGPAQAVGLTDRGRLECGLRADVIRVRRIGGVPTVRGVWVDGQRVA